LHTGTETVTESYVVSAGTQQVFQDVVVQLGVAEGTGALEVVCDQAVTVTSRTYNASDDGSYGQSLDSVTAEDAIDAGDMALLQQLREDDAFRSNIGVFNMETVDASVQITLFEAAGTMVGSYVVEVPPGQIHQDTQPFRSRFGRADITSGYAAVEVQSGAVWAYASVIDQQTSDPTTIGQLVSGCLDEQDQYYLDAHSQLPPPTDPPTLYFDDMLVRMDENNVRRSIVMIRGEVEDSLELADWIAGHPDRLIAALSLKVGQGFETDDAVFLDALATQLGSGAFDAMGEMLLYHAEKHDASGAPTAPEVLVTPDDPKVTAAVDAALSRGWPFIFHIEFLALGNAHGDEFRTTFEQQFEQILTANPEHPFALNHAGELTPDEVRELIQTHSNFHVLTGLLDLTTELTTDIPDPSQPVSEDWIQLMEEFPDRFVFALDRVWSADWDSSKYARDMGYAHNQLSRLSEEAREAVRRGNAERLWGLSAAPRR
jgi:predicted TIM-barrel fold metal-dependent hydrolase